MDSKADEVHRNNYRFIQCLMLLWCAVQALLKTESQLRARETEADLLAEAKGSLSSGAARTATAGLRNAMAAHEAELEAANKQLKDIQTAAQQASNLGGIQQADAAQKIR